MQENANDHRASAVRKLLVHSLVFTLVMALLAYIAFFVTPHYRWLFWVALGWGLGLALHAVRVLTKTATGRKPH